MRITGVESTSLFGGTIARPLQIIRVTVEGTGAPGTGTITVGGSRVRTEDPFGISVPGPGESRTFEVPVRADGPAGVARPVTVIAQSSGGDRITREDSVTVAEPGWTMWMVSHFHYDPVWWSTQGQFTEARLVLPDEDGDLPAVRTAFELVTLHLEKARRDADYKFVLAEVDYLKPYFDAFPAERAFLRKLFAEGRCELVGGTYNEPNTNLTSSELTIRSAVYGMGYQRDVLGGQPRSAWMLDAFGFDPGFPSLMAAAGLTSSSWARGPFHQWGPDRNTDMQFPAEFEWVSPDGGGLLTSYMANHYGAGWGPLHEAGDVSAASAAAYGQFTELAPVAATRNVMLPVGADHVLPARWVTDVHRSWNSRYVWPRFVTAIPRDYFDAVRSEVSGASPASGLGAAASPGITPQSRDMNPVYTGKDVSFSDTKLANRAGEIAVSEGERFAALAWLRGAPYPAGSLDKAWRQLAYGAHHDAITGTESDQVYLDLLSGWREAWQRGDEARREACTFLSGGTALAGVSGASGPGAITVFNGLARPREGMATATVTLDEPGTGWLAVADDSGAEIPALAENVTRHPDGSLASVTLTFRATGVPGLGSRRYALRAATAPAAEPGWADVPGTAIENDLLAVTADPAHGGALTSVISKATGREALRGPGNELVLQEEYPQHPRWGEGPWHLSPKGPGTGSAARAASSVRAQRSPAGQRLVAEFTLGDLTVTSETILWDGADRVEFRTHVSGSIGSDHLLRVRFPADVPGGLPVYQTATAVIGRPFGVPEADTAQQWWTLDNPAHQWFGVGSVASVSVPDSSSGSGGSARQAIGVGEVISPGGSADPGNLRDLIVSLAQAGVTATSSRADGPRYGAVNLDSNLPDFRIALGGPDDNAFTAAVLDAAGPQARKRLAELAAEHGTARLWVPAARPRTDAVAPEADLRGPRDLPVLIVSGGAAGLEAAVDALRADLAAGPVPAEAIADPGTGPALGDGTVALFNAGTPSGAVTPDGTLWMALMRACSAWPSGVWIDGDPRTAPDGSSFAWQHWSHTFRYALAVTGGDWREAGFNAAAEDYNHALTAMSTAAGGSAAVGAGLSVSVDAPNVTLTALKPRGNPLAAGRLSGAPPAQEREMTVRLRETDGRPALARLRIAPGIEAASRVSLLEDETLSPLEVADGTATVELGPFETATLAARVASAGTPQAPAAAPQDEPVRPPYARYWLHGTGAAPAGNLPVTVAFAPPRATLRPPMEDGSASGGAGTLRLSVACGPEPASGHVALALPPGISAEVDGEPAGATATLPYDLDPNGYATWDVSLRAAPETADGRYFVTAAVADASGHSAEDAALVTVGEPGPPERDLPPDALFGRMMAGTQGLAAEADVSFPEVADPASGIALPPGERGRFRVRVANHLASELRGAVQLISPFGAWEGTPDWTLPVTAAAGGEAEIVFDIAVPAGAAPGWESWLLVKLAYFGRVRYSPAVRLAAG